MTTIDLSIIRDLNFLTPTQAIIVYLIDEKGMTIKEVSEELGRYSYNVKVQYEHAQVKILEMTKKMEKDLELLGE